MLKGRELSGVNWRAAVGVLYYVSSYDATACQGESIWEKEEILMACVFHLRPWSLSVLLRHVFSIWVSLTAIVRCKRPLSTGTETEWVRGGQQCVMEEDLSWLGVRGEISWPKAPMMLTSTLRKGRLKVADLHRSYMFASWKYSERFAFTLHCIALDLTGSWWLGI